jgi:hypothetical protein
MSGMKRPEEQDQVIEPGAPSEPAPIIFEAIVRKTCVRATYNRTDILFAPHAIWMRHGDLFVDGVTIQLNGKPPREPKLGTFKLIGMADLTRTEEPFFVSELFVPADPKYDGQVLLAVEPD